jgi:hypothetical protein
MSAIGELPLVDGLEDFLVEHGVVEHGVVDRRA